MEIDFSELYKHSGGLVRWSPDGRYLAVACGTQLVLRHVRDCSIAQIYACADLVEHVSWSFDSQYVLCACYQRATVDVWSVERPDWTCRITEGAAGMASARWGPDGRHVLTVAAFQLHLTVWSLLDGSATKLEGPKHAGPEQGICFSPDTDLMAVAHRRACKDVVTVYNTETWSRRRASSRRRATWPTCPGAPRGACSPSATARSTIGSASTLWTAAPCRRTWRTRTRSA